MALAGASTHNCAFARHLWFRCNNSIVRGKVCGLARMIEIPAVHWQSEVTAISHRVQ